MKEKNLVKTPNSDIKMHTSDTYADALKDVTTCILSHQKAYRKENPFDLKRRYILFVPDKYTLQAEKLLYGGGNGAFDIEVLTINRLCYRLAEYAGVEGEEKPLSRLGAVLTMRRIITENADKLECFQKSASFAGFAERMYDNICQIAAGGYAPQDLPDGLPGILGRKLHDVKLLYTAYKNATAGKYVDATGRLLLLDSLLCKTDYFANTEVYFACFDGFTPLSERIVQRICNASASAARFDAACLFNVQDKEVETYAAPSQADELKAAAVRICDAVRGGMRYDDIGVLAPAAEYHRLARIFNEYDIPFFADRKYALSDHPLARYILDLFAASQSGTNANYIALSKNPYCGVSANDADIFENYIFACSLSEGAMYKPFDFAPKGMEEDMQTAERVRAHLTARVSKADKRSKKTGQEFCQMIEDVMPNDEEKISQNFTDKFPNAHAEITAAAAVIADVFPAPVGWDMLMQVLQECFAVKEVAVLPNRANRVEVGDASLFRVAEKKYLFVLGMHEGEVPPVMRDDGIFSDKDLLAITQGRKEKIEPSIEALNLRAEKELSSVLSSCGKLFVSYRTDATPSPYLLRLPVTKKDDKELRGKTVNGKEYERLLLDGTVAEQLTEELRKLKGELPQTNKTHIEQNKNKKNHMFADAIAVRIANGPTVDGGKEKAKEKAVRLLDGMTVAPIADKRTADTHKVQTEKKSERPFVGEIASQIPDGLAAEHIGKEQARQTAERLFVGMPIVQSTKETEEKIAEKLEDEKAIKEKAENTRKKIKETERALKKAEKERKKLFAMLCPTREAAIELYRIGTCDKATGGSGLGFEELLDDALGGVPDRTEQPDVVEAAGKLHHNEISVSRVQEYFACPLRCFLHYGLKLKPRPDGAASPLDLGTFLHKVIELYVGGKDYAHPDVTVPKVIQTVCHDYPEYVRGMTDDFIAELSEEAKGLCAVITEQLASGDFIAEYNEIGFGDGTFFDEETDFDDERKNKKVKKLHGRKISLSSGEVTVKGVIDRLDVIPDDETETDADIRFVEGRGRTARIVDYKTGYVKFALSDIYYGRKIQLAVYMKVAQDNGFTPVGMFYFPFSTGFQVDKNSYKLLGLFDKSYAESMDKELATPKYSSTVVSARSTADTEENNVKIGNYTWSAGVDAHILQGVCDYAEEVLCAGAEEMLRGYCAPVPLAEGNHSECDYCQMRAVCTAFGGKKRERRKNAVKADFIVGCLPEQEENAQENEQEESAQ